jgi:S-DNA-T family DNA segregation ATPase FtsK/SpoIIIE
VLIQGLQNFKKLRQEDEFSFSSSSRRCAHAGGTLAEPHHRRLGARHPRHRHLRHLQQREPFLGRKALSEFEMRVVFQMSASDSASLIDSPERRHARPEPRAVLQRPRRQPRNFPALRAAGRRVD